MKASPILLILVGVAFAVPVIILGGVSYWVASTQIEEQTQAHLESLATIHSQRVQLGVISLMETTVQLTQAPEVARVLRDQSVRELAGETEVFLAAAQRRVPEMFGYCLIGDDGPVVTSVDSTGPDQQLAVHASAFERIADTTVGLAFASAGGWRVVLPIAAPVADGQGRRLGVLVVFYSLEGLTRLAHDYSGLGKTGEIQLAMKDIEGSPVLLHGLRFDASTTLKKQAAAVTDSPLDRAVAGQGAFFDGAWDYRGKHVLAATAYIAGADWGLVVKMDEEEAYAAKRTIQWVFLGSIVAACGLALLLSIGFTILTSRSLEQAMQDLKGQPNWGNTLVKYPVIRLLLPPAHLRRVQAVHLQLLRAGLVLAHAPDAVLCRDLDGRITYMNSAAEKITGLAPSAWKGMSVFDLMREEQRAQTLARAETVLREGSVIGPIEWEWWRLDGKTLVLSLTVFPVMDTAGRVIEIGTVARDVTETVRLRRDLEVKVHELEQFAHSAAHDLRGPLLTIQRHCSKLLEARACDEVEGIRRAAEWIGSLVTGLQQYAQVGTEERPVAPVDLNEAAAKALSLIHGQVGASGAQVHIGPLPHVMAREHQMVQLFQNLIENGVKYNRSERPAVEVACVRDNGVCTLSFKDNGIGVPPDQHRKIFEVFHRAHPAEFQGNGLGLAICQHIVSRHGGEVWVESTPGGGSTFFVTLPG